MITRLLIANRGEIAVRIIRAAKEMGIHTILASSSADLSSLGSKLADEVIEIGPPAVQKSYLNMDNIIDAAKETYADAIHPGYGFLAENAEFARRVVDAGIIFVGPDASIIEKMGDKSMAREFAIMAGVPVVPGSNGIIQDLDEAKLIANTMGYPLMIKATAGGGGKGIRIVHTSTEFEQAFKDAQREGLGAFKNSGMYLERFIDKARHIEVQILADGDQAVHLYDRECSLQRSRQKIMEEAPSPRLTEDVREKLCASAVALAQEVKYKGVGTIEYLYDEKTGEFFFIEMNTRIQVEHPISEMVTGFDLIKEMIHISNGGKLRFQQQDIQLRGVAIECRINAEDPFNKFLPNIGTVEYINWAQGPGVRVDSMLFADYTIPPFYDSLLAKIIVWDQDRTAAFKRLQRVLSETQIKGLKTTLPLHQLLATNEDVLNAAFHTNWLEEWLIYLAEKENC